MKRRLGKSLCSMLLALAMVIGLMPGMGMTAYAAGGGTEVTQANVICQQYSYYDADRYSGGAMNDTPPADITNITLADAQAFGAAVNCPTTYWVVVYAKDGDNLKWTSNGKTGEQTSTPYRTYSAWFSLYNGDVYNIDPNHQVTFYFSKGLATVSVTGVSLDKTTAQTIDVGGTVSFTATVSPDNATDKTVTWTTSDASVATVDNGVVTAVAAGTATITATATNGTDDTSDDKTATCTVTVNAITYTVTYSVVNGTWSDGTTADKTETVQSGSAPASVPSGMIAGSGFTGGSWDTDPASATITGNITFTYTFEAESVDPDPDTPTPDPDPITPTPDPDPVTPDPEPVTPSDTPAPVITPEQAREMTIRHFVERIYLIALNRSYDVTGRDYWVDQITDNNVSGSDIARGFFNSQEFIARELDNEEFVNILYRVFFDREPDTQGFANWINALENGATRSEVINGFTGSTEWTSMCARFGINA